MRKNKTPAQDERIDITPMLDIVFILLIFFIVTTSFTKESGITIGGVSRAVSQTQAETPVLVRIDARGRLTVGQRLIDVAAIRANLERLHAVSPQAALVIAAHPDAPVDAVVSVVDAARLAGIASVQVAASAS